MAVHERLGRAYMKLRDFAAAERELAGCIQRRGEAALWLTPTLRLLPRVAERSREPVTRSAIAMRPRNRAEARLRQIGRSPPRLLE